MDRQAPETRHLSKMDPVMRRLIREVGPFTLFYRPMAIAIIGGTITSTILTLLVVPTFYDSIEIARDRAFAKFRLRRGRWNAFMAFVLTMGEALLALMFVRLAFRMLKKLTALVTGRPVKSAALAADAVAVTARMLP